MWYIRGRTLVEGTLVMRFKLRKVNAEYDMDWTRRGEMVLMRTTEASLLKVLFCTAQLKARSDEGFKKTS